MILNFASKLKKDELQYKDVKVDFFIFTPKFVGKFLL